MVPGPSRADDGGMTEFETYPTTVAPTPADQLVGQAERDRVVAYLQQAYAQGRLDEQQLDRRLEQVLGARRRRDLDLVLADLAPASLPAQAFGLHPVYRPMLNQQADGAAGRALAGVAHLSAFISGPIGPGAVYMMSKPGTFARRQAAKAVNLQITAIVAAVVVGIVSGIVLQGHNDAIMGLGWLGWFLITLISGLKAFQGESWRTPVDRFCLTVLRDDARPALPAGRVHSLR